MKRIILFTCIVHVMNISAMNVSTLAQTQTITEIEIVNETKLPLNVYTLQKLTAVNPQCNLPAEITSSSNTIIEPNNISQIPCMVKCILDDSKEKYTITETTLTFCTNTTDMTTIKKSIQVPLATDNSATKIIVVSLYNGNLYFERLQKN